MLYEFISLSERPIAKRTAEIRLIVFLLVISLFQVLFAVPAKSSPVSTENMVLYDNYSPSPYANIVTGQVTNLKGEPLVGVSVTVKGATSGTSTDAKGSYSIDVPPNGTLVFTYVGFASKEAEVANRSTIEVVMEASVSQLEQVVVVGYGTAKKKTLTGSVASVSGADIIKAPVMNVSNSLSGRLPGVTAITRGAEPGNDGATIRIRGSNTLGDNSALIIVDGIPGRSMDRIDPNSIESITVLKDASAAIYGSQAANGVILVTTKRGRRGKPQVAVNLSNGFTQPTRIPKMTNAAQYATALNELDAYQGAHAKIHG